MPDTESDHHRDVAAVARLDLVAPPTAPVATTSSSCATATATARDEDEEDGFTFAAVDVVVATAIPPLQDADDSALFPDARISGSPVYPVFGRPRRSLSLPKQQQLEQEIEEEQDSTPAGTVATARRVSLQRLLLEEQWSDCAPSASGQQQQAADADAEAETYCLWSPARCRNSGSTGSSVLLRWRRRRRVVDGRSHSDGKDRFEFMGSSSDRVSAGAEQGWMDRGSPARGGGESTTTTTFLRCKQDLVELVASVVTCRRSCYLF